VRGGCYSIYSLPNDGAETFVKYVCDDHDGDRDGILVVDDLHPSRYRLHEEEAPAGFKPNPEDAFVVVGRSDVTIVQAHERLAYVLVTTTNADTGSAVGGSCWRVRFPGDREGLVAEACDADDGANDGTTRLTTVPTGQWELLHTIAPNGYTSVAGPTPFAIADDDLELAFALAGPETPVNVSPPTVTGTPRVGVELAGGAGTWTGTKPLTHTYRWERCNATGAACLAIAGATAARYTPVPADLGATLRLAVTVSNLAGSAVAHSSPTAAVAGDPPVSTEPPAITGPALLGALMRATPGSWTGPAPIEIAYRWQRCDTDGDACVPIAGATADTYVPAGAAFHHATLRVLVTASNADGATAALSPATPPLLAPPRNVIEPTVLHLSELPTVGARITGLPGTWVGARPIAYAAQWLRCDTAGEACTEIEAATEWSYRPQLADIAHTLRLRVTATNVDGTHAAPSQATSAVVAVAPLNVTPPLILGGARLRVGADLLGRPGTWVGTPPVAPAPQWLRCDDTGETCLEIPDATDWSYRVSREDVRHTLRLRVTATNIAGSATAFSALTGVLHTAAPQNLTPPFVLGIALVGEPLRGFSGAWGGTRPLQLEPQWLRCDYYGSACDAIAGATGWTFVTTPAERGYTIRLAVTATNPDGTATARSDHTGIVPGAVPGPVNSAPPTFWAHTAEIRGGARLVGRQGTWSGTRPIAYDPQWLRCDDNGELCLPIAGATAWSYVVGRDDVGHTIRLAVTATNTEGSVTARSVPTPLLPPRPPLNLDPPLVSGDARIGGRLRGHEGTWAGARPIQYAPRWRRCTPVGDACILIAGATGWVYVPTVADAGGTVRFEVTATNLDGSRVARSQPVPIG
jgi:hypothetical protein